MNSPQAKKIHSLNEMQALDSSSVQQPFAGFPKLKSMWMSVMKAANVQERLEQFAITAAASTQPQITQKRDRNGQEFWKINDPVTGRSHTFSTEEDIRVWYEQRHQDRPATTNFPSWLGSVHRH